MHVYVQKSTATTFPRKLAGVNGAEFSQPLAPSREGKCPSTGNARPVPSSCTIGITFDVVASRPHLARHDGRLPFFGGIRGELRRVAAADVLQRVDRLGRDEQDLAGPDRRRRLALDLMLQHAFRWHRRFRRRDGCAPGTAPRVDIDARLGDLASRDAQVVLLGVGARLSADCCE
jgi:hypothetical protein